MTREHDFDMNTKFCLRCGKGLLASMEDQTYECVATDNVVGISHRVRGLKLRRIIAKVVPS